MRISVARDANAEREVSPLELLFDLVYVFAIGQLADHLLAHVDLRTGVETAITALAVVYAWQMITWAANWLEPERLPVKLYLLGLMFASLLMSAGIPEAFDGRAWLFVAGYLILQVGRASFLIVALRGRPLGEHFVNDLVWEVLIGGVWAAGAIAKGDTRLILWGVAVSATYFGAWALHWLPGRGQRVDLEHMEVSGGHLFERFRLFFLIALGEAVFLTGNALTDTELGFERFLAVSIAFTGIVVLWWIYFQGERFTLGAREDSGTVGWQGTIALTLAILGVIAVAVGDELAIARPTGDAMAGFAPLAFGGPALVLVAQTYFLGDRSDRLSRSRLLGIGALAALGAVASLLPAIIGLAAATGALVAVAIADVGAPREPR